MSRFAPLVLLLSLVGFAVGCEKKPEAAPATPPADAAAPADAATPPAEEAPK
jgi:hypothetical protein